MKVRNLEPLLLRHRWAITAWLWAAALVAYAGYGFTSSTGSSLLNDGATDLLRARLLLEGDWSIAGHWTNSMMTTHPGPVYMFTLAAGGWLGVSTGLGFDSGAAIALTLAVGVAAMAASWAVGRVLRSVSASWVTLAVLFAVASLPVRDGWGAWPRLGFPLWAGMAFPWAILNVCVAIWAVRSRWKYRFAYAFVASGLCWQLYMPSAPLVGAAFLMALLGYRRARSTLTRRARLLTWLAFAVGWGSSVLRAVTEGPLFFLPREVLVYQPDSEGRLTDAATNMALHLGVTSSSTMRYVALAVYAAVLVALAVHVRRSEGWTVLPNRSTRVESVIALALAALGLYQVFGLWSSPIYGYQSSWITTSGAVTLVIAGWRFSQHRVRSGTGRAGALVLRTRLRGSALVLTSTLFAFALSSGWVLQSPAELLGPQENTVEQFNDVLRAAAPDLRPGDPVALYAAFESYDAAQGVANLFVGAGYDLCIVDRPDLRGYACSAELPEVKLHVRPADAAETDVFTNSWILLRAPFTLERVESFADLAPTLGEPGTHPLSWWQPLLDAAEN